MARLDEIRSLVGQYLKADGQSKRRKRNGRRRRRRKAATAAMKVDG